LRVGHFPASGAVQDLHSDSDTVLVWPQALSQVVLHGNLPGRGTESKTFLRRTGMIDVMPAGALLHEVNWQGSDPNTVVSVNFPAGCLKDLWGQEVNGLDPERGNHFGVVDLHVTDLVQRLQEQIVLGEPLGAAYVQGLSLTVATYVMGRFGALPHTQEEEAYDARLFRRTLVDFVEANLASNIGLVDLARLAGYSPDHFARLFKREFRVAPYQYLLTRRIERAKAMLLAGKEPIAAVAWACGFASQAHLGVVFKRFTGVTPAVFRKR